MHRISMSNIIVHMSYYNYVCISDLQCSAIRYGASLRLLLWLSIPYHILNVECFTLRDVLTRNMKQRYYNFA